MTSIYSKDKVSVHSKGHRVTAGCHDNTTGEVDRQGDDWEQGSCHDSMTQHHVSKPWKKHHNKHKNQKVRHKMKKAIES